MLCVGFGLGEAFKRTLLYTILEAASVAYLLYSRGASARRVKWRTAASRAR